MAQPQESRKALADPSTLSRALTAIAQCLKWILLSLGFSILAEWIGLVFWWPEEGLGHSQAMLARELNFLAEDFRRSVLTSDPVAFAHWMANGLHHGLFELTGITWGIAWISPAPTMDEQGLRTVLHELYAPLATFVLAALQITQVFAVRLGILTLATPVFGLFGMLGLIDGLVRRDLRRWGGGRESSFIYHYAKKAAIPLIVSAWVFYLSMPISIHPSWIILPFAVCFALTVTITASTFKKYL